MINETLAFSDLGGRLKTEGRWPTKDEWTQNPARPEDWIFASDEEVRSYFAGKLAVLDEEFGNRESLSTFEALLHSRAAEAGPKESVFVIETADHVVRGLAMPYSTNVNFLFADMPWTTGGGAGSPYMNLAMLGKDNDSGPPVNLHNLRLVADPEAIDQTLDYCTEIAKELFASSET